ncbi:MAG: hypothetical protein A2V88_08435 [Elusimicrobia bacterium RBG_16_66_12]|nr:MAG: hypothetical protein A2V88_08435 [Elusimicrobia bacterium RBG_16_66_12]
MNALRLVVLGAAFAAAAPAPSAPSFPPREPYWLKTYSTASHQESWNAELSVGDLDKVLPQVLKAVEKGGGKLTQPLQTFPASGTDRSQQLSLTIPKKGAEPLVKRLRKLGEMRDPLKRPLAPPVPIDEVRAKISRLMKEKIERASALSQVPAAAEASEEILEHLLLVEAVAARAEAFVLFNLTVRGR